MSKKWIFLDFDNTLMATEQYTLPSLIARFNELYAHLLSSPLTYDLFKKHFHGQARENLCKNLSEHFGITVDYPTLFDGREWRMMEHLQALPNGVEMAPYLIETLTLLSEQEYHFALVTNNPIQRALTSMRFAQNKQGDALARLMGTHFFEAGEIQKPKPDVYLRAMAQVNAKPSLSFAVEDSISGTQSAVSAGLTTFGYIGFSDNPEETKANLLNAGCVAVFKDWKEFPALLQQALQLKTHQELF